MKKMLFLTFLLSLPFLPLFSLSISVNELSSKLFEEVFVNAPNSYERFHNGKLYLKSECLSIENNRILLFDPNGCQIELPSIFSDEDGLYVLLDGKYVYWECSRCHEIYSYNPGTCDVCGWKHFYKRTVNESDCAE